MTSTDNVTKPALLYHDGAETMNAVHQKATIVARRVASGESHESATTYEL
ncbi:MAG: hypothetical protein RIM23_09760 [Coleofasciculus sp. G3-WIS-01]